MANAKKYRYNRYLQAASLYDYDNRSKVQDDIPFYTELVQSVKGKVLELGCGTGRVSLPILKTGAEIVGLDDSEQMLNILRTKISQLDEGSKRRITLVKANMSNFSVDEKFKLIILPYSTFQGLSSSKEITGCFNAVRNHLQPDGLFVFSCFRINGFLTKKWASKVERTDFVIYNEDGTKLIERKSIDKRIDINSQIIYCDLLYTKYENNQVAEVLSDKLKMKYYYPDQIEQLIKYNCFEVIEKYGYFDKRPFDSESATQMIFKTSPIDKIV